MLKAAVITVTRGGVVLASKIKDNYTNVDIYTMPKYKEQYTIDIEGRLEDLVGKIFHKYTTLIFIMATGIVVRSIAKHIQSKTVDPGVLVVDEKGEFVISLLSGHIGKANENAVKVAKTLGGQAVITTASDVNETIAVDTLATKLNCTITDFTAAKRVTALLVNGEKVGLYSEIPIKIPLPKNIKLVENSSDTPYKGLIYISNKAKTHMDYPFTAQLIVKNIIIGIGCRKGKDSQGIMIFVKKILKKLNIHPDSVKAFATVEEKKNEQGLITVAKNMSCKIEVVSKEKIKEVQRCFSQSSFVEQTIGVTGVCEPCAYLASGKGKMLLPKTVFDGITLSIWEEKNE